MVYYFFHLIKLRPSHNALLPPKMHLSQRLFPGAFSARMCVCSVVWLHVHVVGGSTDVPSPGSLKRVGSAESLLSKNNSQSTLHDSMYPCDISNYVHKYIHLCTFCSLDNFN